MSEKPFVMSQLRARSGKAGDDSWWDLLPESLRDTDGIVVPVHDQGELAWSAAFPDADLSHPGGGEACERRGLSHAPATAHLWFMYLTPATIRSTNA